MADYQIIDATGSFVNGNVPYSKTFVALHDPVTSPYFTMWVKTGYSDILSAASVRVNGTEVDKVWPRPWTNHSYVDFEAVPFIFSFSLLRLNPHPVFPWINLPAANALEVVPLAGPANWVLVHSVIYHFRT